MIVYDKKLIKKKRRKIEIFLKFEMFKQLVKNSRILHFHHFANLIKNVNIFNCQIDLNRNCLNHRLDFSTDNNSNEYNCFLLKNYFNVNKSNIAYYLNVMIYAILHLMLSFVYILTHIHLKYNSSRIFIFSLSLSFKAKKKLKLNSVLKKIKQ